MSSKANPTPIHIHTHAYPYRPPDLSACPHYCITYVGARQVGGGARQYAATAAHGSEQLEESVARMTVCCVVRCTLYGVWGRAVRIKPRPRHELEKARRERRADDYV